MISLYQALYCVQKHKNITQKCPKVNSFVFKREVHNNFYVIQNYKKTFFGLITVILLRQNRF